MPGKAAKITITERQQEILQTFSRSVTAPSRLRQRASIIVLAFDGLLNEDIAERVGLTHRQVGRWRRRWPTRRTDSLTWSAASPAPSCDGPSKRSSTTNHAQAPPARGVKRGDRADCGPRRSSRYSALES